MRNIEEKTIVIDDRGSIGGSVTRSFFVSSLIESVRRVSSAAQIVVVGDALPANLEIDDFIYLPPSHGQSLESMAADMEGILRSLGADRLISISGMPSLQVPTLVTKDTMHADLTKRESFALMAAWKKLPHVEVLVAGTPNQGEIAFNWGHKSSGQKNSERDKSSAIYIPKNPKRDNKWLSVVLEKLEANGLKTRVYADREEITDVNHRTDGTFRSLVGSGQEGDLVHLGLLADCVLLGAHAQYSDSRFFCDFSGLYKGQRLPANFYPLVQHPERVVTQLHPPELAELDPTPNLERISLSEFLQDWC